MRIILKTQSIWAVAFNVPIAEFHNLDTLQRREGFRRLGQDVLAGEFNVAKSVASLRARGDLEVGEALDSIAHGRTGQCFQIRSVFRLRNKPVPSDEKSSR